MVRKKNIKILIQRKYKGKWVTGEVLIGKSTLDKVTIGILNKFREFQPKSKLKKVI